MSDGEQPRLLRWDEEAAEGAVLHIARHRLPRGTSFILHQHDFCEVMLVEAGELDHVWNGQPERLTAGDLRCLRPEHVHAGTAVGACTLVNLSFHPESVRDLAVRCGTRWPWTLERASVLHHLSPAGSERLHGWAAELASPGQRLLDLDCFLLDLARLLTFDGPADHAEGLPGWLREVLPTFAEPRHLRGGVPALATLCGRGQAHLNRTVRSAQGRRATDLVNAVRLSWAAAQLRMSQRDVGAIASACGLPHLGHFYALFEATFGCTPAQYRRHARGAVPPPNVSGPVLRRGSPSLPAEVDVGRGSFAAPRPRDG